MILITGATGYIGKELVKQLKAANVPVRVLARNRNKAAALEGPGVEIVEGDFDKPKTLDAALVGVEKAFLLSSAGPQMVELQGNFVQAAQRAGIRHLVKSSAAAIRADGTSLVDDGRWHRQVEKQLEESGMAWTHLRPGFFTQNIERYFAATIKEQSAFYAPMGNTKAAIVDVRDIAAVAVAVLTESGHEGKAYIITGPEALSFYEVAEKLSAALGRQVTYVDVPVEEYAQQMRAAGQPEWLVTVMSNLSLGLETGGSSEVTNVVKEVANKQPLYLEQYLRESALTFKGTNP